MKISKLSLALIVVLIIAALALFAFLAPKHAHSVTLNWSPSVGATSYNVYRGTKSGGPYEKVGTVSSPTFVDTKVASGDVLYYVVTSVKGAKESGYSKEIKAAVP
jgi:fibronectin type 3 domain-containing protein